MSRPGPQHFAFAAGGALAGFLIAMAVLSPTPPPVSFAQCVLNEMKGRPEHVLAFAIGVCRERQQASDNPIAWGAQPVGAAK
jgi:hypothetical protein